MSRGVETGRQPARGQGVAGCPRPNGPERWGALGLHMVANVMLDRARRKTEANNLRSEFLDMHWKSWRAESKSRMTTLGADLHHHPQT